MPIVFLTIKRFAAGHAGLDARRRHVDIAGALRLAESAGSVGEKTPISRTAPPDLAPDPLLLRADERPVKEARAGSVAPPMTLFMAICRHIAVESSHFSPRTRQP